MTAEEKTEMLERLGEIYLSEGVKPKGIAQKIMEKTGMSYRWVMKYLPDKFKGALQSERASAAARRAAGKDPKRRVISIDLEEPPKGVVSIKTYGNTNFVNVIYIESSTSNWRKRLKGWRQRRTISYTTRYCC